MKPIEVSKQAAQGDVLFRRVKNIPAEAKPVERKGPLVVAHSETGHHHSIDDSGVVSFDVGDPLVCYLQLAENTHHVDVVHHRSFDTHATVRLVGAGSCWEARRQREYIPTGWRRVED